MSKIRRLGGGISLDTFCHVGLLVIVVFLHYMLRYDCWLFVGILENFAEAIFFRPNVIDTKALNADSVTFT